jgi:SAM-dependent methyltransferase
MSQLEFDEETGRQLEAIYQIRDAVRRRSLVRAALGASPGERILDVGCGPGFYCLELAEEVGAEGSVLGIDSSGGMLALAARRCEGHPNVEFREAEATSLPVEDGAFDGLVCVQVLEYVPDVGKALAEFHRALRPGGRVVLWDVDWSTLSWHSEDPGRMARALAAWDEHLADPVLPRTLAAQMASAGFKDVRMEAHPFAASESDPEAYIVAATPLIAGFIAGRADVSEEEAEAWASEQRDLGDRGEFFCSCTQFCFTGLRPT